MSDQLHFIRGGRPLDPEVKVPMVECGSCECYHRSDFWGDCRNDSQRFLPHDLSDGEPEYVCANEEPWITDVELTRRIINADPLTDSHPHNPHQQGASS